MHIEAPATVGASTPTCCHRPLGLQQRVGDLLIRNTVSASWHHFLLPPPQEFKVPERFHSSWTSFRGEDHSLERWNVGQAHHRYIAFSEQALLAYEAVLT